jgi:Caspase domain
MPQNKGIGFPENSLEEFKGGTNHLFAIGINAYEHFMPLSNARKDIEDISKVLVENYYFETQNIRLLCDEEATKDNIIDELDDLRKKVKSDDRLLIYYSGHGFTDEDRGFWIPVNAKRDKVSSYLANAEVRDIIQSIKARHILLISDSCFSASLLVRDASRDINGAFTEWERNPSRWVFISGKGVVSDGKAGTNSPFAASILNQLRQNDDDALNIVRLADRVTQEVRFDYEQQADISPLYQVGHKGGQFVFLKRQTEKDEWEAALTQNTEGGYLTYLDKYPNGLFVKEAEQKLFFIADEKEWKNATQRNAAFAYRQYLKNYPKGNHVSEANGRLALIADIEGHDNETQKLEHESLAKIESDKKEQERLAKLEADTREQERLVNTKDNQLEEEIKFGTLLYSIPSTMQIYNVHRCTIRVAYDKKTILKNLTTTTENIVIKEDIRVAEVMEVTFESNPDFIVKNINDINQVVEKGDVTEWNFDVRPQRRGRFPLTFKISISLPKGKKQVVLTESILVGVELANSSMEFIETDFIVTESNMKFVKQSVVVQDHLSKPMPIKTNIHLSFQKYRFPIIGCGLIAASLFVWQLSIPIQLAEQPRTDYTTNSTNNDTIISVVPETSNPNIETTFDLLKAEHERRLTAKVDESAEEERIEAEKYINHKIQVAKTDAKNSLQEAYANIKGGQYGSAKNILQKIDITYLQSDLKKAIEDILNNNQTAIAMNKAGENEKEKKAVSKALSIIENAKKQL